MPNSGILVKKMWVIDFLFDDIVLYLRTYSENAGVVELVDTLDLGSSAARLGGSSPSTRTQFREEEEKV